MNGHTLGFPETDSKVTAILLTQCLTLGAKGLRKKPFPWHIDGIFSKITGQSGKSMGRCISQIWAKKCPKSQHKSVMSSAQGSIIIYSPQDIAIFDNLIGSLLEAYETMYHYYLIWEVR